MVRLAALLLTVLTAEVPFVREAERVTVQQIQPGFVRVVARYGFNAPTIWSYDVTYMLYATIFMLGAAYALHKGAHIRTDFFFERWSIKTRGIIDSVAYLVFFFPAIFTLMVVGWTEGYYAFTIGETSEQTPWRPILWPFKMVVPLACLLLLVQGISETIKSVWAARTGIELEHKEKVEV